MQDSHIDLTNGGTSFVGHDAVNLFRAMTLKSSIRMYMKCGLIPTRGVTITKMLVMAGEYTGKTYKRGQGELAMNDLVVWIETMKCAMPVVRDEEA